MGEILNRTRSVGPKEQLVKYQTFCDWPENLFTLIYSDSKLMEHAQQTKNKIEADIHN